VNDLAIYGCGGHARELLHIVEAINQSHPTWNFVGFLDDDVSRHGGGLAGAPILGDAAWLAAHPSVQVVAGIGATPARRRVVAGLRAEADPRFATIVHPEVVLHRRVRVGVGVVVFPGCRLTTDIELGDHVALNLGVLVSHDCRVGDFVTVGPNANLCGNVRVGEGTDVGTGSVVIQGIEIGAWSIIGAGATVIGDVARNVTVVGTPAKIISSRSEGWADEA